MAYLAEILASRRVKDPVKMYADISAFREYEHLGREFAESVTFRLQKEHRAYLATTKAFSGSEIIYADNNPDDALREHEEWHKAVASAGLVSAAGDFIEEAAAMVIESVKGGYDSRYSKPSENFVEKQLWVQDITGSRLERRLERFAKNIIPEWDEKVLPGSCPWLRYIEDAKYLLFYELCRSVSSERGIKPAKNIYKTALKKTKQRNNVMAGVSHLRKHASRAIAELYNDEFDVSGYFPSYRTLAEYVFFGGGIKIEICGAYHTWLEPVEKEIKKRGWEQDETKS